LPSARRSQGIGEGHHERKADLDHLCRAVVAATAHNRTICDGQHIPRDKSILGSTME
jgi:hypothetical protein